MTSTRDSRTEKTVEVHQTSQTERTTRACSSAVQKTVEFPSAQHIDRTVQMPVVMMLVIQKCRRPWSSHKSSSTE